jgi:hypothetical protein
MRHFTVTTLTSAFLICLICGITHGQRTIRTTFKQRSDRSKTKQDKIGKPSERAQSMLTSTAKKGLDGAFVQLWPEMSTAMNDSQWQDVLEAMNKAGLQIIIVQYLRHNNTDLFPSDPGKFDAPEKILTYADGHPGTQVFIGLGYDTAWYNQWRNDQYLRTLAEKNRTLATTLWTRYGSRHASFSGWYIPQEMWNENYTADQIKNLRELYYASLIRHCKSLSKDMPIAVAPFFNPNKDYIGQSETPAQNAERFAELYAQLLNGSQIDIVMLQDGVGARKIEPADFKDKISPYYDAFRRLCAPKVKELWADLEAYREIGNDKRRPAPADRFLKQVEMFAPLGAHAVTFEFFHYMNPHGHLKPPDYKRDQEQLYAAYMHGFRGQP